MSPNPLTHQWQACSQLLPPPHERLLVYRKPTMAIIRSGHITISQCRLTTSGPIWDCDQSNVFLPSGLLRCVTHWMPLPAAPVNNPEAT